MKRVKLKMKPSNRNQLSTGVILSYINLVLSTLISLVYTPFLLRSLGKSEYGLYQLVFSIVNNLNILSLGLGSSYIRFYFVALRSENEFTVPNLNALFKKSFSIITSIVIGTTVLIALGTGSIFFSSTLSYNEQGIARILVLLLGINVAFSMQSVTYSSYIMANERFTVHRLVLLVQSLLTPIISSIMLLAGKGSIGVAFASTVVGVAGLLFQYWYAVKRLSFCCESVSFSKKTLKSIFGFSTTILAYNIADSINWSIDKVIIGAVHGTAEVAVFGVGSQLNFYFLQFSTVIASVFVPRVNHIASQKTSLLQRCDEYLELLTKVGRLQFFLVASLLSGFVVFGREFICWWAGIEYGNSYEVALLLMFPMAFELVQNLGIEVLRAENQHRSSTKLFIISVVFRIPLTVYLGKNYGAIGAAVGASLSYLIGKVIAITFGLSRSVGVDMLKFWGNVLKSAPSILLPTILIFIVKRYFIISLPCRLIVLMIFFIASVVLSICLLGLNEQEKRVVKHFLRKAFKYCRR